MDCSSTAPAATTPGPAAPAPLVVRRLLIDLQTAPSRHWAGGDAFRTAFFNALSMSFPAGEQFFIDSMRRGLAALPEDRRAAHAEAVRGFIGQEATHRRIHALFNTHLERQGLVDHWQPRILRRLRRIEHADARIWLGVTAATEHFTAIMAEDLLTRGESLAGTEPRLAAMWLWHASEESEHRSSAFDLYRALGGDERWRLRLFRIVSWHFVTDLLRQTLNNLHHDGTLWRRSTWAAGWRFLFRAADGGPGLVRRLAAPWRRYPRADFHPAQQDGSAAVDWLRRHGELAVPVASTGASGSP